MSIDLVFQQKYTDRLSDITIDHYTGECKPISCVGCRSGDCCRQELRCLESEMDKLADLAIQKGVDLDKLKNQALDWDNSDKTCVFLENGQCGIYEDRPLVCRRHLVTSPRENCKAGCDKKTNVVYTVEMEERLAELLKQDGHKEQHFQIMQLGVFKRLIKEVNLNDLHG